MNKKELLILASLMKLNNTSIANIKRLYNSVFPERYIKFIIQAKPYWEFMIIDGMTSTIWNKTKSKNEIIKIYFLIKKEMYDKFYYSMRWWNHITTANSIKQNYMKTLPWNSGDMTNLIQIDCWGILK